MIFVCSRKNLRFLKLDSLKTVVIIAKLVLVGWISQNNYNTKRCYLSIPYGAFFIIIVNYCNKGSAMFVYRRIRDLREDNDKTQSQIAEVLNMQLTVYQRYERGEREIPFWVVIKLADYYKVSLDYIAERTLNK